MYRAHRRRIKTEEKAKVVTSVWGTACIKFLGALAIWHQDDFKKRANSFFYKSFVYAFNHSHYRSMMGHP